MKVEMIVTKQGSPNGITVNTYKAGEIVDLPKSLYDVFIANKWCKDYEQNKTEPEKIEKKEIEYEKKSIDESPENKMIDESPAKKTRKPKEQ